jgi:Stress responsive A/B Barrel Domain
LVRHVFLWQTAPAADPGEVLRLVDELPTRVPEVVSWTRGPNKMVAREAGDPWDFCLVCDFKSWEDLRRYYDDTFHQQLNAQLMPMFAARAVCDFEF